MLSIIYAECCKQTRYAECRPAECHCAECRGAKESSSSIGFCRFSEKASTLTGAGCFLKIGRGNINIFCAT